LFEILVREHAETVRAFLLASVRDAAAVEDLLQDTFLVAWKNLERYDRRLPFGPWVRGIAAKLLLNWRRSAGRSRLYFCDEEALAAIDRRFGELDACPGDTFDAKVDVMRGCMVALSDHQRRAIDLHYQHGLPCVEIAQRLGLGLEAVKKHLQRGRAALLRCMRGKLAAAGLAGGVA
jgi:RNA polymerase sigma-70 factor (ECF subfamily)